MGTDAKVDFKRTLKHLYAPPNDNFTVVDVPEMQYMMVDGQGPPGNPDYVSAVEWLFATSYAIKFISKGKLGRDYVVPPLEGLWWADDMSVFTSDDRDAWRWTMMIMQPEWISPALYQEGLEKSSAKLGTPLPSLRLESLFEGTSVQILHLGPFAEEAPTIERLHTEFIPQNGFVENGQHHEIYLSDPRRVEQAKLRTVLRQPVRKVDG